MIIHVHAKPGYHYGNSHTHNTDVQDDGTWLPLAAVAQLALLAVAGASVWPERPPAGTVGIAAAGPLGQALLAVAIVDGPV